jgi:hypothetical protein
MKKLKIYFTSYKYKMSNPLVNRNYEHYYNITLLDDLHNYFPDILYSNRFNDNPLVVYIQEQTENIFNMYSSARNRHRSSRQTIQSPVRRSARTSQQPVTEQIRMTFDFNDTVTDFEGANALLNLLNGVIAPPRNFHEAVIVRPTQQQINAASSIVELSNSTDNCSICQEPLISESERVRRLTHCQHMFHHSCITTWFATNVRCPVCRHDIRNN